MSVLGRSGDQWKLRNKFANKIKLHALEKKIDFMIFFFKIYILYWLKYQMLIYIRSLPIPNVSIGH